MKLRYYAEADTGVDHRRTVELLNSIADSHAIPVEIVQIEPQRAPPAEFTGATDQQPLADAWDDFTYNPALQDGLGSAPSEVYPDREDIVGNVGIVVDGDLVWATRFWGTHHGWGPVDPEETAIGFLEAVEAQGMEPIVERVPLDEWSPAESAVGDSDASESETLASAAVERPTRDEIRDICTAQSFQRGVTYFEEGRVRDLTVEGSDVSATVRGSREYRTTVDLAANHFAPYCSCPYDYAGECKHVVAVLLTVADRFDRLVGQPGDTGGADDSTGAPTDTATAADDLADVLAETDADTLRAFLGEVLADDPDLRERFLAVAGVPVDKSVTDYKRELDQRFADATGRHGFVEHDTRITFETYHKRAESYREQGLYDHAIDVYRALAEAIRENLDRVDDSSGHYGRELEHAIDAYAACVREQNPDRAAKREYIDYLIAQYDAAEFAFVREYYDDALRDVCEATADLEYLCAELEPRVPDRLVDVPAHTDTQTESERPSTDQFPVAQPATDTPPVDEDSTEDAGIPDPTRERLDPTLFVGDALDVASLSALPIEVTEFVGETLATKLAEYADTDQSEAVDTSGDASGSADKPAHRRQRDDLTRSERDIVSTYLWALSELDERDTLRATLETVYTDTPAFYRRYVETLLADGQDDRAENVIEDGLDEFGRVPEIVRLAADFYRDRDGDRYRELMRTLFVRFEDWDAYDELRAACSDQQWETTYHGLVTQLGRLATERLVDLYLHEGDREKALAKVLDSDDLTMLRQYRDELADVDPEAYFAAYRDALAPYLAAETGRDHYRTVIEHLREMDTIGLDDRLAGFVADLRDTHSNRPALLDELDKAGF